MKSNFLFKSLFLIFTIVFVVSCDKDFNEIGSELVDDNNFVGDIFTSDNTNLEAFNQVTGPVQTNNLPINSLGYLNNAPFGSTTSSFVTQLELGTVAPKFYDSNTITIDSVYIYVPYFSHVTTAATSDTDANTYALDSVIGNSKIKLSVYRSGYYLRDFDENGGFVNTQKYYSNQQPEFEAAKGQLIYENNNFGFEKTEIKILKNNSSNTGTLKERLAPGIFFNFDSLTGAIMQTYFLNNIIKAPSTSLINNNAFKQYFRGLYFKAENAAGGTGAMARVNFAKGKIVIVYHDKTSDTDVTRARRELILNMTGNTVNLFQNEGYTPPTDHKKIDLKGGEGNMAILKLFGGKANNEAVDLNTMRREKWLINEASITFNVADDNTSKQPKRIYLYDLQNKRPIIDYYYDSSTATNSKYNKYVYGGILVKDNGYLPSSSERGTKYKIRITNYLRSLVKNGINEPTTYRKGIDSTNVKLGLVVTEAIMNPSNAYLKNTFSFTGFNYADGNYNFAKQNGYIPAMSVANPLGVTLYGANIPVIDPDYNKRMKLEIKYTKPN